MTLRNQVHRLIAAATGLTLLVAACASDEATPSADPPVETVEAAETTTPTTPESAGGRGWIDGEPEWLASATGEADMALGVGEPSRAAPADGAGAPAPSGDFESELAPTADSDAIEPSEPPVDRPSDATPLRAGSVDDNVDFDGFLAYLDRIAGLGVVTRDLDPTGRSVITVVDAAGRPVPGASLDVAVGERLITLRTTANGTARFHPGFYGLATDATNEVNVTGAATAPVSLAAGESVRLVAPSAAIISPSSPVPLDVLFLLDATGSMGDEIDRLKQTIDTVAQRVAALDPAPDVRFAMTLYRDEGDAFVTASYDFTGDIAEFQAALANVVADGGGDYPEALDEGLADALAKPAWRDPATTVQLIFVVADAPPQVGRQVDVPYTDSIRTALERGIKIFPVASSESDDQAEAVFRQMAQATGAPFVFLSNGASGAATGESTDIASTDYEELALDELVVRLIAEELSALNGDRTVTVPTTVAPATTNPEGQ